jgi:hypothetical protein
MYFTRHLGNPAGYQIQNTHQENANAPKVLLATPGSSWSTPEEDACSWSPGARAGFADAIQPPSCLLWEAHSLHDWVSSALLFLLSCKITKLMRHTCNSPSAKPGFSGAHICGPSANRFRKAYGLHMRAPENPGFTYGLLQCGRVQRKNPLPLENTSMNIQLELDHQIFVDNKIE